jgi:hypothetical protein
MSKMFAGGIEFLAAVVDKTPEEQAAKIGVDYAPSFRISDLSCRTVRWKPFLCPRTRDHPVGFRYRKQFVAVKCGHGAACSQVTVERAIKTPSVELSLRIQNCNGKPRTGIRLVARTIAGAQIREAAAPMKRILRVIRWSVAIIVCLRFSQFCNLHGLASRNQIPVGVSAVP